MARRNKNKGSNKVCKCEPCRNLSIIPTYSRIVTALDRNQDVAGKHWIAEAVWKQIKNSALEHHDDINELVWVDSKDPFSDPDLGTERWPTFGREMIDVMNRVLAREIRGFKLEDWDGDANHLVKNVIHWFDKEWNKTVARKREQWEEEDEDSDDAGFCDEDLGRHNSDHDWRQGW